MDKNKILLIVFCVCLSLFLLLSSYKMVFSFSKYNPDQQGVVDFLQGKKNLTAEMTTAEAYHLEDVKRVMDKIDYVFYFLLLVCTLIFSYAYRDKTQLKRLLLYGGISAFSLVVLFLIFAWVGFNWLFTFFHQVFFPQGNWLFTADSFLIQTFPLGFFIAMTWKIIGLSLFLAIIFILGGLFKKK